MLSVKGTAILARRASEGEPHPSLARRAGRGSISARPPYLVECRAMPAQLVALNDGPSILLDKPILLLGRHPECDVQIDSRKISRRHCCIAQVSDYLVVRDLGSTN